MPVVATVNEFLQTARKSKQLDEARLDAFLAEQDGLPADPRKLAAMMIRKGVVTLFQAEQFLLGKYKGFQLGGYRILERLGSGGAGTVYLAEHAVMRRRAAIKVLPTHLNADPSVVERFHLEAQAAAALDHPNVVHVYDFRHEGRVRYIVMQYVEGANLQQILDRKGPLGVAVACAYARQAAAGLHHAHLAGLVHRDVKPANLIDEGGVVKVLDLGLARVEGAEVTDKHERYAVLGTADYLAPEQALSLHDVDRRADVYGLGATLFCLLTGRPPFHGGSVGRKLMRHQTQTPERVDELRPEVPAGLADLVAAMLQKRPDDRPQTMEEVALALSPWADLAPPPARPSARSLAELRLASEGRYSAGPSRGRKMGDTAVMSAQEDTANLEPAREPPPVREEPDVSRRELAAWKLLALGGLALALGLAVGVATFLALGRP